MKITIKYCGMWGYRGKAQGVGDEILDKYPDVEVILEVGSAGQFDVFLEDVLIFSKDKTDRFPVSGEIISLMGEG